MQKKFFVLIIASSMLALPITAQEDKKNTKQELTKEAYNTGFKQGIAGTLAASCIAMLIYLDTSIKKGLYIPAGINCKSVPDGYTWKSATYSPTNQFGSRFPTREPKFKTVCDDNPLYQALEGASGNASINGKMVNVQSNMIQEMITSHAPQMLLATCVFVSFGAFCYYSNLFYKNFKDAAAKENLAPSNETSTIAQSSVETAA